MTQLMQMSRLPLQLGMPVVWSVTSIASELSVKTDPAPCRTNQESPQRAVAPPAAFVIVKLPPTPHPSEEKTYLPYLAGLAETDSTAFMFSCS